MANVKHLHTGHGDPRYNNEVYLRGDEVGNHLYQDLDDYTQVWMALVLNEYGQSYHYDWGRLMFDISLIPAEVNASEPSFSGQIGYLPDDGSLYIAMWDSVEQRVRWRSMGTTLGAWFTP